MLRMQLAPSAINEFYRQSAELMAQSIREEKNGYCEGCNEREDNLIDHLKIKQEKIDALCTDLDEKDKEIDRLKAQLKAIAEHDERLKSLENQTE